MRIGIIGSGGAGTTAAWLLEQDHDVTLFERNDVLGGHAQTTIATIGGRDYPCDDGFAWFSDQMYPLLLRMLALHGIEIEPVRLAVAFTNRDLGCSVVMPPTSPSAIWRMLREPRRLRYLLAMDTAIRAGVGVVSRHEDQQTLSEFVDDLGISERARAEFVKPFLFGIWGGPWGRSGDFSAYPVLKYPVLHRPTQLRRVRWLQVKRGAAHYIDVVARSMERARVLVGNGVASIVRSDKGGWLVTDAADEVHTFDHLICATGASDAKRLLADVDTLEAQREALSGFEYYVARLATHRDTSFMPPDRRDWRTVHVDYDGGSSRLTAWVGWRDGVDLFTSYVAEREPRDVLHWSHYNLPLVSPAHFQAQKALAMVQGQQDLHFCGDWTQDIGSHEDAVRSAVDVVRALHPNGDRLAQLTGGSLAR
ncbi:MAG: FAD-dependent oxidoreductase [Myxococcales bacterium]|nr:FAD-dependent oxidoreductase [Myxococcales bacterium]